MAEVDLREAVRALEKASDALQDAIECMTPTSTATWRGKKDQGPKDQPRPSTASTEGSRLEWLANRSISQYFLGENLKESDVDAAVNTMTLVCALILTIPFQILGSLGHDYWDWKVNKTASQCGNSLSPVGTYSFVFNLLNTTIYSSVTTIVITVFYYLLRPNEGETFLGWWKRGRWVLGMIFTSTAVAVISALTTSGSLLAAQHYFALESDVCNVMAWDGNDVSMRYKGAMGFGLGSMCLFTVLSIILMF